MPQVSLETEVPRPRPHPWFDEQRLEVRHMVKTDMERGGPGMAMGK